MKKILFATSILPLLGVISCGKSYSCQCTDPTGTYEVFTTNARNKSTADERCDQYYNDNFTGTSKSTTTCKIK